MPELACGVILSLGEDALGKQRGARRSRNLETEPLVLTLALLLLSFMIFRAGSSPLQTSFSSSVQGQMGLDDPHSPC